VDVGSISLTMSRIWGLGHAPTLQKALLSSVPVKVVQGPVESGKTVWGCLEMYKQACLMPRGLDGIRRSRFIVTRTTDQELKRGIMRTWQTIFPKEIYGSPVGKMPAIHTLRFLDVEMEVEFFAFEDDSDASLRKLRSTEYTSAYVNEGQYCTLKFFLAVRQRTGRYPAEVDNPSYDREKRIHMDMNAPPVNDHWVSYMRGDIPFPADWTFDEKRKHNKPDDWEFFVQPPAVRAIYNDNGDITDFEINPEIENLPYQKKKTILDMTKTGDIDDIKRDLMNLTVQVKRGKPRYPKFKRDWNVSSARLEPVTDVVPIIGYDPGFNGAATFWQQVNGQWRGFDEIICRDNPDLNSAEKVGKKMLYILSTRFPWYRETGVVCWGDPFGSVAHTSEEDTYYKIIGELGLEFDSPEPKDSPSLRMQIGTKLVSASEQATPRLLLCRERMPFFIDGMDGGAVMKQTRRSGTNVTHNVLDKLSKYADVVESAEYAWWGGGEDHKIVENPAMATVTNHVPQGRANIFTKRASMFMRRR